MLNNIEQQFAKILLKFYFNVFNICFSFLFGSGSLSIHLKTARNRAYKKHVFRDWLNRLMKKYWLLFLEHGSVTLRRIRIKTFWIRHTGKVGPVTGSCSGFDSNKITFRSGKNIRYIFLHSLKKARYIREKDTFTRAKSVCPPLFKISVKIKDSLA